MQLAIFVPGANHEQLGSGSYSGEICRQWLVVALIDFESLAEVCVMTGTSMPLEKMIIG